MVTGDADFIGKELAFVMGAPNRSRWERAIQEVPSGGPSASPLYPESSGNLIHYAYHLRQFEEKTRTEIMSFDLVFEFGGGYGGMCRLIHNLGFKGKYLIFDFPRFSALQRYYLRSTGLDVTAASATARTGIVCLSDLAELEPMLSGAGRNALFIATWSLSETPMAFRARIVSIIAEFKAVLIAYQGRFEGNDNIEFFQRWMGDAPSYHWHNQQIEHIPNDFYRNNYYLIGKRSG